MMRAGWLGFYRKWLYELGSPGWVGRSGFRQEFSGADIRDWALALGGPGQAVLGSGSDLLDSGHHSRRADAGRHITGEDVRGPRSQAPLLLRQNLCAVPVSLTQAPGETVSLVLLSAGPWAQTPATECCVLELDGHLDFQTLDQTPAIVDKGKLSPRARRS